MERLSLSLIKKAHHTFKGWFSPTPIEYSPFLSDLVKTPVILKHEFLQPSGSYKLRGYFYFLSTLKEEEKKQGVALCDPHNSAISLAYAAHLLKIPCTILTKETPSLILKKKLASFGAELLPFADVEKFKETSTRVLFSSCDDTRLLAGCGGSLAIELLKDVPQLKNVIVPLGHGDLAGGLIFYLKRKFPDCVIIGCELDQKSMTLPSYLVHELPISLGSNIKKMIDKSLSQKVVITEKELIAATKWLFSEHQISVEPFAAIGAACLLSSSLRLLEGPTAVLVTGRSFSEEDQKLIKAME